MRRPLRRAFNFAAAVSGVLLVGVCVLWVRSYFVWDTVWWRRPDPARRQASDSPVGAWVYWEATCGGGRLFAERGAYLYYLHYLHQSPRGHETLRPSPAPPGGAGSGLGRLGFAIDFDHPGTGADFPVDRDRATGPAGLLANRTEVVGGDGGLTLLAFPLWFPAALLAALPAAWVVGAVRRVRRRRPAPGTCTACGYDLRATPEAGGALLARCPECGAVPGAREPAGVLSQIPSRSPHGGVERRERDGVAIVRPVS